MSNGADRWRFAELLGRGGTASVYSLHPADPDRVTPALAAKLFHASWAGEQETRHQLTREAQRLLDLSHQEHFVRLHDLVLLDDHPALLMERLEGMDIDALIATGPLEDAAVWAILHQVASALHHMAWVATDPSGVPLRIVHRDLSPRNLFLTTSGALRILDLGMAWLAALGPPRPGGTIGVEAPEQQLGDATLTPAVDIHAVGAVAVALRTGMRPPPPAGRAAWVGLLRARGAEPDLITALESCLATHPGDRPSASALAQQAARHVAAAPEVLQGVVATRVAPHLRARQERPVFGPWTGRVVHRTPLVPGAAGPPSAGKGPRGPASPPGAPYDPRTWATRPDAEAEVTRRLGHRGEPVVVYGPAGSGKTWLLHHTLRDMPNVLWLDLRCLRHEALTRPDLGLHALVEHAALQLGVEVPAAPPLRALGLLLERELLSRAATGVLVLDHVEVWARASDPTEVFGALRARAEQDRPPWDRFRLALAASADPSTLVTRRELSPFNLSTPIELHALPSSSLHELARAHGLELSATDERLLNRWLGDNVLLLRTALFEAQRSGLPLGEVLEGRPPGFGPFARHLRTQWSEVRGAPGAVDLLRELLAQGQARPDFLLADRMCSAGLVTPRPGGVGFSCLLYERFFRDWPPG